MTYILHILVISGIYTILTLSLNLLVGYTGMVALGHGAFYCVGAYASALLTLQLNVSPWLGILLAAFAAGVLGFLIGYPSIRLKGDYFALATFGFAVIVHSVAQNWQAVTRGPMGLPGIPEFRLFGYPLSGVWSYLIVVVLFTSLTVFIIERVVHSPFGRVLKGIREDEIATMAMGKDVRHHKIQVFIIGAIFAGIAGSLYAHYITYIDPSSFTVMESITILLMVVFGGLGSLKGSILGAITLIFFPEFLRFLGMPSSIAAPLRQMIYGLLLILLMLKRPQGLLGTYQLTEA